MNIKPNSKEMSLVGSWVEKDGFVTQDLVCERIQWLTANFLEQIVVDGENWCALYKSPDDDSYWELTYPQSHMQGGGPPSLQRVSNSYVGKQYAIVGE